MLGSNRFNQRPSLSTFGLTLSGNHAQTASLINDIVWVSYDNKRKIVEACKDNSASLEAAMHDVLFDDDALAH